MATLRTKLKNNAMTLSQKIVFIFLVCSPYVLASQNPAYNNNKFKQLYEELPTPTTYRTASGAPGHDYWQQQADYDIRLTLDDNNQRIVGEEIITYHNLSPDYLDYLWIQLDQNIREPNSSSILTKTSSFARDLSTTKNIANLLWDFDGGFNITKVASTTGAPYEYHIVGTMMRIQLPAPLEPKEKIQVAIDWNYNINNTNIYGGRSGYERFLDGNNVYCIAQFYPRMCVYNDVDGWQNKQFLGRGEFTLPFGDYKVSITVPEDHLVAATGLLTNPKNVLNATHRTRLDKATKEFEQPIIISSSEEAKERSKKTATDITATKTWSFEAKNVRDFAFATSRRFIWDAMNTKLPNGNTAMAMSMYVEEGKPLWQKYSTKVVAHTLQWYSHYTIDYPYPVAWSIDGDMGMEYPMICFNYGRCAEDGTYSKRTKYGHIGVIIHEVGHNFFPMIINSDERQWTWMDEGLNTFVQFLTEQHWERDYPSRRGQPYNIVDYMKGDKSYITPIMTNSESILQFGNNAYGKPATALNILRETVLGRENFDYAFKQYCRRWAFKNPSPADLFRTLEDASGVDLDWFWRGWFYTTDHCDISLDAVNYSSLHHPTADHILNTKKEEYAFADKDITRIRNAQSLTNTYSEKDSSILDFYNVYPQEVIDATLHNTSPITANQKDVYDKQKHFYELSFQNIGGLVMPIILDFSFADGTDTVITIPAEIWALNNAHVTKVFALDKKVTSIELDPFLQTADCDRSNNFFPARVIPTAHAPKDNLFPAEGFNTAENEKQLFEMRRSVNQE